MNKTFWSAIALVAVSAIALPAQTRGRNYNLNISMNNAEKCSDIQARSSTGELARVEESVTLGPGQASAIELEDTAGHSVVQVRGWDRAEYAVETCKIAVAETQAAAQQLLAGVTVSHSAGRFTTAGPLNDRSGNWQVYFLIRAPRNGNVDLSTKNGPVSVTGVGGNVKLRAVNGPVSVSNCGGRVDAQTTNGPISFSGGAGDVRLNAKNGPISLTLVGETWTGQQLDAATENGPVNLTVPENYRSSVRLKTAGHAPLSCNIDACRNALTDASTSERLIRINGAADTIKVSTTNGPVSIHGPRKRMI